MSYEFYNFNKKYLSKIRKSEKLKFLEKFDKNNKNLDIQINSKDYFVNKNKTFKLNIKAISLFSGAGGLDIGSQLAGVEVISSMDFDKDSIETIKNNNYFKKSDHFCEDIRIFDLKNIIKL